MASVTYKIGGKYDNSALKQVEKGIKDFQNVLNAVKGAAIVTLLSQLTKKAQECESAFLESERAIKRIDFASAINPNLQKTSAELKDFAKNVSESLRGAISVDEINEQIAKLSFDKTGEQIQKLIPVAIDLSAAMGISLNDAVTQLNNTFSGATGTLGKMFPELKNLSKESLSAGDGIDVIAQKVKGMGNVMAQSGVGSVQAYKNALQNLKESIGGITTNFFTPMRDGITKLAEAWANALANLLAYKTAVKREQMGIATKEDYTVLLDDANKRKAKIQAEPDSLTKAHDLDSVNREIKKYSAMIVQLGIEEINARKKVLEQYKVTYSEESNAIETVTEDVKDLSKQIRQSGMDALAYAQHLKDGNDEIIEMQIRYRRARERELRKEQEMAIQLFKDIANGIQGAINSTLGDVGGIADAVASSGWLGVLIEIIGKIGDAVSNVSAEFNWLKNSISTLLGDILTEDSPFVGAVKELSQAFMDGYLSLKAIVGEILNILGSVVQLFASIFASLSNALNIIAPAIKSILAIITEFAQVVMVVINIVSEIANAINDILPLFKVVVTVITVIADVISNMLTAIYNLVIGIYNLFASEKKKKPTRDYKDIGADVRGIWQEQEPYSPDLAAYLTSTVSGSSGSASYSTPKDVYVNIYYTNSFVNGDARAIAIGIRDEIIAAERLGY